MCLRLLATYDEKVAFSNLVAPKYTLFVLRYTAFPRPRATANSTIRLKLKRCKLLCMTSFKIYIVSAKRGAGIALFSTARHAPEKQTALCVCVCAVGNAGKNILLH